MSQPSAPNFNDPYADLSLRDKISAITADVLLERLSAADFVAMARRMGLPEELEEWPVEHKIAIGKRFSGGE